MMPLVKHSTHSLSRIDDKVIANPFDVWCAAQQGHRKGVSVQSSFKDLVPLQQRTDVSSETREMVRPSEEDVQATAERTKLALEKLVNGKIKAAQPKHVPNLQGKTDFMRYTPQQGGVGQQKIIKMVSVFLCYLLTFTKFRRYTSLSLLLPSLFFRFPIGSQPSLSFSSYHSLLTPTLPNRLK